MEMSEFVTTEEMRDAARGVIRAYAAALEWTKEMAPENRDPAVMLHIGRRNGTLHRGLPGGFDYQLAIDGLEQALYRANPDLDPESIRTGVSGRRHASMIASPQIDRLLAEASEELGLPVPLPFTSGLDVPPRSPGNGRSTR